MALKGTNTQKQQMKDIISLALIWSAASITVGFLVWVVWYILSTACLTLTGHSSPTTTPPSVKSQVSGQ